MAFRVKLTFKDDTELTVGYRLTDIVRFIKDSPLNGIRTPIPVLPWLIDMGLNYAEKGPHRAPVRRIDVEEKVTL